MDQRNNPKKKLSKKGIIAIVIGVIVAVAAVVSVVAPAVMHRDPSPGLDKPMIYIYPEKKMEVSVKLGNPERLTTFYPEYNDGWKVTAEPGGKLTDKNGREYYGLYWEGKDGHYRETDEGFVVKGDDVTKFLEEKLAILGLNEREAEEFIVYWLPKMNKNEYNYVRFATAAEIDEDMPLIISPKPDTTIRIMMVTKALERPITLKEQNLKNVERKGYTVVEWGGTILDEKNVK